MMSKKEVLLHSAPFLCFKYVDLNYFRRTLSTCIAARTDFWVC